MRKVTFLPLLLLGTASFACSSSSGGGSTPDSGTPVKDTGTADHVTHDAPAADAKKTTDAGTKKDTGATEGGPVGDSGAPPTPVGMPIEKGTPLLQILGVTDDGYVIYQSNNSVKAVAEAGGTPMSLVDAGEAGAAGGLFGIVIRKNVFIWSNVDQNSSAGTLTVWNHSLSKPTAVSTTAVPFVAATSDDSSAIVFSNKTSADGTTTDLVGASLSSLTTLNTLATGADPGDQGTSCSPEVVFTGTGASLTVVVGSCVPPKTDGGSEGPMVINAFPVSTWKAVPLSAEASFFSVDDTGSSAAILLASGALEIAPLAGGAPVVLGGSAPAEGDAGTSDAGTHDGGAAHDAGAPGDGGTALSLGGSFYLSQKDSFVLFNTGSGGLISSELTKPDFTTLLAAGAVDLDGISPNESFAIVDSMFDDNTGGVTGLALVSTSTPNKSTSFVTGMNEAGLFGDAFTADSNYVVYLSAPNLDDLNNSVGTLMAASVSAPTKPITVAKVSGSTSQSGSFGIGQYAGVATLSNELLLESTIAAFNAAQSGSVGSASATDLALTGSKIAFSNNFNGDVGTFGQTDIEVVDLSTTTAATSVMKAADPVFAVSPDRKYIIYTITFGGPTDGIYTVPVP